MKNMTTLFVIFLYFLCPILCVADTWEDIYGQDTATDKWDTIEIDASSDLPDARYGHSMVTCNNKIYIACGINYDRLFSDIGRENRLLSDIGRDNYLLSDIWRIDVKDSTATFTQIYKLGENDEFLGTAEHSTFVLNNKLYVLYGLMFKKDEPIHANAIPIDAIYSYDLTSDRQGWIQEYVYDENDPEGCIPRYKFATAAISDKIYVFGGYEFDEGKIIDGDQRFGYFSYTGGEWSFHKLPYTDGPSKRVGHTMVSVGNTLYLFGGLTHTDGLEDYEDYNDLWKYDESKNAWEKIETEEGPSARCFHNMIAIDNMIYVLGGVNKTPQRIRDSDVFEMWGYDAIKSRWVRLLNHPAAFAYGGTAWSYTYETQEKHIYQWGGYSSKGLNSNRNLTRYTIKAYTAPTDEETGKSGCGCLGIEFVIMALLSSIILKKRNK
ncbi:MAG TPA: kelch repeat-containing protein [Planctomycetota bacterium]|nr:kelch repeat-containing protein [Planctomycetota bacterium]